MHGPRKRPRANIRRRSRRQTCVSDRRQRCGRAGGRGRDAKAGPATADEIAAAVGLCASNPSIRPDGLVVIGHSAGSGVRWHWASEDPKNVAAIIAFAPDAVDMPMIFPIRSARAYAEGGRGRIGKARG